MKISLDSLPMFGGSEKDDENRPEYVDDATDKELQPAQKNHISFGRQQGVANGANGNKPNNGVNIGIKLLKVKRFGAFIWGSGIVLLCCDEYLFLYWFIFFSLPHRD